MSANDLDGREDVSGANERYPQDFGRYLFLAPLGRGGMGAVYLAKSGGTAGFEKHCVVKTLRRDIILDDASTSRFLDEARVVVQLNHKGICNVFDFGKVNGRFYLAMDFVAGRELSLLMARTQETLVDVPKGVAFYVVNEVLEALDYAHRLADVSTGDVLGIVHRDVSPQNVMLSFEGEVKLIDFGLAVSAAKTHQTQANVVIGKLRYMSPEQARGDPVDARTDLFAAGVMTYELVTGYAFYDGMNNQAVWAKAGIGGYRPAGWPSLDPDLAAILDVALAADPAHRFATCADFREALESYAFQRGFRGGAKALREMMVALFDIEHAQMRELLGSYAHLSAPTTDAPAQAPTPGQSGAFAPAPRTPTTGHSPAAERTSTPAPSSMLTEIVPRASGPVSPSPVRRGPSLDAALAAPRGPTTSPGGRRLLAAAAGFGVLVIVGAVVLALTSGKHDGRAIGDVDPAALVATRDGPPPSPVVAPPTPPVVAPPTPPEDAPPKGEPPPSWDLEPPETPPPVTTTKPPVTTTKPPVTTTKPPVTKPKPKPPADSAPIPVKLQYVQTNCPRLPCTKTASTQKADLASAPTQAKIQALQDVLRKCVATCAK